jgi:CubicO group peptidase (beta-lactamase class C family)
MAGLGYTSTDDVGPIYMKEGIPTGLCSVEDSLEAVMKRLGRLPLRFDPGERFEYGLSTDVLGRVVEVVSKMPLDQFMAERIFRPLGMTDTFFHVPSEKLSRLVSNYLPTDSGIRKLPEGERTEHLNTPVASDYHLPSNKLLSGGVGCAPLLPTTCDSARCCSMEDN